MPPPRAAAVVNATRHIWAGGFQVALAVKNPSANAGDVRDPKGSLFSLHASLNAGLHQLHSIHLNH